MPKHTPFRYHRKLKSVDWLKQTSPPGAEYLVFEMSPYGEEARQSRQTTSAPLDASCPLEQLRAGKIRRSSCIAWHYANIDWQERLGETLPRSIGKWSEVMGFSARTLWETFKESPLFQRISTTTHATVLKVFPFLNKASREDRHRLSDAEIQASYSEVIFTAGKHCEVSR